MTWSQLTYIKFSCLNITKYDRESADGVQDWCWWRHRLMDGWKEGDTTTAGSGLVKLPEAAHNAQADVALHALPLSAARRIPFVCAPPTPASLRRAFDRKVVTIHYRPVLERQLGVTLSHSRVSLSKCPRRGQSCLSCQVDLSVCP